MRKRWILSGLALLLLQSHIHGSSSSRQTVNKVFLGSVPYCFELDGRLLYFQPTGSHLNYAAETIMLSRQSPQWRISDIQTSYHYGFDAGLAIYSSQRHLKTALHYTHFQSQDNSFKISEEGNVLGPFFAAGPDGIAYSQSHGGVQFKYQAINLTFGIAIHFGNYLITHFFCGVHGARIKENLSVTYANSDDSISRKITTPSSFLGAGPELGVDFKYLLLDGFYLKAYGAQTLLVGKFKNYTNYESISEAMTPSNIQTIEVDNRTGVVPAFEGRLGLACDLDYCDCVFKLEAGYEARLFLNAIQSVDTASEVINTSAGIDARTFQRNISNFAVAGPYLSLSLDF